MWNTSTFLVCDGKRNYAVCADIVTTVHHFVKCDTTQPDNPIVYYQLQTKNTDSSAIFNLSRNMICVQSTTTLITLLVLFSQSADDAGTAYLESAYNHLLPSQVCC